MGHIRKIPKATKRFWAIAKDQELTEVAAGSYIQSIGGSHTLSQDRTASICGVFDITLQKSSPPPPQKNRLMGVKGWCDRFTDYIHISYINKKQQPTGVDGAEAREWPTNPTTKNQITDYFISFFI
uniref:Uncharacterized protein n=1 Tax=Corethron hystrix TaxID=216773 RepID=A0A6U5I8K7_9STRA|mmetsp:Transcript_33027/g.76104  ORF Transcript_33027/g.76104 Transcript_33027/m.76104 type:complete len:126 (+) Transcript_33027:1351-1728(+)